MDIIEPLNGTGAPHYRKSCRVPSAYVYAVCLGIAKCRSIVYFPSLSLAFLGSIGTDRKTNDMQTISHFHTRSIRRAVALYMGTR